MIDFITSTPTRITYISVKSTPAKNTTDTLINQLKSTNGLILIGCFVLIAVLSVWGDGSKKKKLATGHFAGGKEKAQAIKIAIKQMKERKQNAVTLYIGKPRKAKDSTSLYVPDVQRGVSVIGAPGSGKTFSVIDPMIRSAVEQGFPLIVYDFKYPTQSARIAGYAKLLDYDVRVFAPGFEESEICNPIDFLRDETDGMMARQIATVVNRNFKMMSQSNEDAFFGPAGDQLTQAVLMLAKSTKFPDIMMAQAILSMDDATPRLMAANMNPWIRTAFGQLFSSSKSEKTLSSIIATSSLMFTRFMQEGTLGSFVGKSTIPLNLEGKQLVIFGMDQERRDVVGPLLATCLHMLIVKNVAKKRKEPLIVAVDELPTIYLPSLVQWLNEAREQGFCGIIGYQNIGQLEKNYGKEMTRAILGGSATKFIFNPQELESARTFSDYLGDEELKYKQKSRSHNSGKTSTSISDQERTRKLFEPSQFTRLPSGTAIIINPAYGNKNESSVPFKKRIKIPKRDLVAVDASDRAWEELRKELIAQSQQKKPTQSDLEARFKEADRLYPIPEDPADNSLLDRDKYAGLL